MTKIDRWFLYVAIVYGVLGMVVGVWLGITQNLELRPLHAHLGVFGWVSLAIFGLAYRAYPATAARRLAGFHFWIASVGALVFLMGVYVVTTGGHHIIVTVGSLLAVTATVLRLRQLAWPRPNVCGGRPGFVP